MNLSYVIKSPSECSADEINLFYEAALKGGQVRKQGLLSRIKQCKFLAFCFDEEKLAGIIACKAPSEGYKNGVFDKALIPAIAKDYSIEIGYAFTESDYRGNRICPKLLELAKSSFKGIKVFATTGNTAMKKALSRADFEVIGEKYKGVYNDELEILATTC
jgi:hypothetical protein